MRRFGAVTHRGNAIYADTVAHFSPALALSRTLRAGSAGATASGGILDRRCARRSAERRSGQKDDRRIEQMDE